MKTSDNGRKFIESFEGLILQAYDDYNDKVVGAGQKVRGTLTIGYGHTTSAGAPAVHVGDTIDKQRADEILASDLAAVESQVGNYINIPLNQNQYDALVSFQFNTGALEHSQARTYLNKGDYKDAMTVLGEYIHANGQTLPGLVRRRKAEIDLFNTAPKLGSTPVKPQSKTLLETILDFINKLILRR